MERIGAWLALALAGALSAAWAVAVPARAQVPLVQAQTEAAAEVEAVFADPLAIGEKDLRMTVPVTIAGSGSWPFVIDTGAERTVLSRELADRLKLSRGRSVRVTTMVGTGPADTARVPDLRVSTLQPPLIEAPLFMRANLGAIGMLGLDALQGHTVRIDFDTNTMALRPSKRRRRAFAAPGEIVVTARSLYGQLIVTDARWRGRKIAVVLDTGSPVTIANPALLKLGRTLPRSIGPMPVTAVTGEIMIADGYVLNDVEFGQVLFPQVPVGVANAAPFKKFGLQDTPALLLGMETLRLFRRVEIDFPGRTIRLTMPRTTRTGSRILG